MPIPTGRRGAKLLPCLAIIACTLAGLLPGAPAAAQQPLDHFDSGIGLFSDRDGSGGPSCGDHLTTRVTITTSVGSFDLTNLTVRWTVPPNTRIVPPATVGHGPESDCSIISGNSPGDTEVVAFCPFLCRTFGQGSCSQVGLDLQALLEILDPNLSDRVALQASADADQVDPSLADTELLFYEPCPPTNPPAIEATLADTAADDHDGDQAVDPGEAVAYTVVLTNAGGSSADQVLLQIPPPDFTQLAAGSVSAPPGATVLSGNGPGDQAVEVLIPDLAPGLAAQVHFLVTVHPLVPLGTVLAAQGTLSAANAPATLTDDPGTVALLDPTQTPVDHDHDLAITVQPMPPAAVPGERITWEIDVRNLGEETAFDSRIETAVPSHTTFDPAASDGRWICTGQTAGSSCSIGVGLLRQLDRESPDFAVRVLSPLPADALDTILTATTFDSGAIGPDANPQNNQASASAALLGAPELALTKSGPTSARPGVVVAYTLAFANHGDRDTPAAELVETVPPHATFAAGASSPGWSCADGAAAGTTCTRALGTLAAGTDSTVTFALRIDPTLPRGAESLTNTARLRDGADSPPAEASATTALDAAPSFRLAKSGPAAASPGDLVAFLVAYDNAGAQDASGVEITETVPEHSHFVASESSAGWSCADGSPPGTSCTLSLGALAAGDGGDATFAVRLDPTVPAGLESITNIATIADGDGTPPASDSATVAVDAAPVLRVTKTGPPSARPGETIHFTLDHANEGDQDAAAVELRDTVPAHTTFDAAASSPGWTCPDGAPAGAACTLPLGLLPISTSGSVTFAVRLAATVPAGLVAIDNTASLHDDAGTPPADDQATVEVVAAPALVVSKGGPSSARPGDLLPFSLAYANAGDRDAPTAALHETVPLHTTFAAADSTAGWSCPDGSPPGTGCTLELGPLAAGASDTATFAVRLATTVPAGTTTVRNTAVLAGDPEDPPDEDEVEVPVEAAADLRLAKDGPASAHPGDLIPFTLAYRNAGDRGTADAALRDTVPQHTTFSAVDSTPGWSCPDGAPAGTTCTLDLGPLAAGASGAATFAVRLVATVPTGLVAVRNSAVLTGDPTDLSDEDDAEVPVDAASDLQLAKDGPSSALSGDLIPFTLAYRNAGDRDTAAATLDDTVPQHTTFSAADSTPGWSCPDGAPAGTACTLDLGPLAAGASGTATFGVRLAATLPADLTAVRNTAVLTGGPDDPPGEDDAEVPVDAAADLQLAKDGPASALAGGLIPFTLAYRNAGDRDTAAAALEDTVPQHTTFSAADSTPGWSCPDGAFAGTTCTLDIGPLAAGASGTVIFAVRLDPTVPAGLDAVRNTAVLTGGPEEPPGEDGDEVPVDAAADLRLAKDGPSSARPGDLIAFTLAYRNAGARDTAATSVHETVPQHTHFSAADSSPSWSCPDGAAAGTTCTLDLGPLAAGASGTAIFTVRLAATVPAGLTAVRNAAVLTGGPEDPPGEDDVDVPVDANATLVLDKHGPATATAGDTVAYTFDYANRGDTTATAAVLTDTVPAHAIFVAADSSLGWSCPDGAPAGTSCTLAVGDLAPDATGTASFAVRVGSPAASAGEIINTATLSDAAGHPPASDTVTTVVDEAPPTAAQLAATLLDTFVEDADGDGQLGAGDVVGYTAVVESLGPAAATGVHLAIAPDPHTVLIPESVTATAGVVDTGSGPGDDHVAVTLGDLAAGDQVVVTFEVRLRDPLPAGLEEISAQGHVTALTAAPTVTDDPDTAQPLDPTVTPLGDAGPPSIVEIPTLHGLGLTALAALLTAVAFRRLRPARRTAR